MEKQFTTKNNSKYVRYINSLNCAFCTSCVDHEMSSTNIDQRYSIARKTLAYEGDLPENLKPGNVISITGGILPNCSRFYINLLCERTSGNDDVAFHFNPRFNERYVVRNCKLNGQWGEEETTSITKFDVNDYYDFKIDILIAEEQFMVSLNGKHICAFTYRVPITKVKEIEVVGLVTVSNVEYKRLEVYPEEIPENQLYKIPLSDGKSNVAPECSLDIPLTAVLPAYFNEGWQINIYGRVKLLPHSFYVNLQEGRQLWPHPKIPLHVNPRFSSALGENIFVRNAWTNGAWGPEERTPSFHFSPGSPFSVTIKRESNHFSLWVDGHLIGEFRFRFPSDEIDTVYIQGDVYIKSIVAEKKIPDVFFHLTNKFVK